MITGLLSRVPSMRSGCGYRGLAQLKKHPFLEGWDWDSVSCNSSSSSSSSALYFTFLPLLSL